MNKTIKEKTVKKFFYRLCQFGDKFVISSRDTKTILPGQPSEVNWKEESVFGDETKAIEAFDKIPEN